jgi:hypothetical protein
MGKQLVVVYTAQDGHLIYHDAFMLLPEHDSRYEVFQNCPFILVCSPYQTTCTIIYGDGACPGKRYSNSTDWFYHIASPFLNKNSIMLTLLFMIVLNTNQHDVNL